MTAIYYLLQQGEVSAWHRVDAAEIWHFYAGATLALALSPDGRRTEEVLLGANVAAGERPQAVVAPGCWQSAKSRGDWTLVGCTVGPAFDFAGFEMAPRGLGAGLIANGGAQSSREANAAPPTIRRHASASRRLGSARPNSTSSRVDSSGVMYDSAPSDLMSPRLTPWSHR